jgi:hypothetical protein
LEVGEFGSLEVCYYPPDPDAERSLGGVEVEGSLEVKVKAEVERVLMLVWVCCKVKLLRAPFLASRGSKFI